MWQKEAAHRLSPDEACNWLGTRLPSSIAPQVVSSFLAAVLPNLVRPDDVLPWIQVTFGDDPALDAEAAEAVAKADKALFAAASAAAGAGDFAAISAAAKAATGNKGPALFKPLRAALTGRLSGPELGPLLRAMPAGVAQRRLARFA